MKENRLDTEDPNVKIVQRVTAGALETIREITSTTGEVDITNEELRKTQEIITITRITIQKIS